MPKRIAALPKDKVGRPVPWFVTWLDAETPDFRVADGQKLYRAVTERRCWVCGEPLGKYLCFVLGPMCAVNRTTSEPPAHRECGRYSAQVCPFLANPRMHRRERDLPEGWEPAAGKMITRNPGVVLLWTCGTYSPFSDGKGGMLFRVGEPLGLEIWAEGREGTFAELVASVDSGMPFLAEVAVKDPREGAGEALAQAYDQAMSIFRKFLPMPL